MISDKDIKAKKLVLDKYVLINDGGNIGFKSELGSYVDKKLIYRDDAFNIVYDLMHAVINYDLKEKNVHDELKILVEKVNKYNNDNEISLKNGALFFKDYSHEKDLFNKFVSGDDLIVVNSSGNISQIFSKKHGNVSKKNSEDKIIYIEFIENHLQKIKSESENKIKQLNENPNISDSTKETRKRKILDIEKRKLGSLIRKYFPQSNWRKILKSYNEDGSIKEFKGELNKDIFKSKNINVNDEKRIKPKKTNKKILSKSNNNNIHRKQSNYSKKQETIKVNSTQRKVEDSKKRNQSKDNDNKLKDEILSGLNKMKTFNKKTLSEMFLSKDEYSNILDITKNDFFKHFEDNPDFINFKYFFNNLDEMENAIKFSEKIKENENYLNDFFNELNRLDYLSYSERVNMINKFSSFYQLVLPVNSYSSFIKNKIFDEFENLKKFMQYYEDLNEYRGLKDSKINNLVKIFNEKYIRSELYKYHDFFNDICDENKKRAIVIDEDNVKVVAGAGAGKTFIIEKKIRYLIEKVGIDPERILCLCFTKKNVDQLSKRVNKNSKKPKVKVFTFHEFCRRVDKECKGEKTSNRYLLDKIIRKYVKNIVNNPDKLSKLIEYFSYYSLPQLEEKMFKSIEEYEKYREGTKLVSLKKKFYKCEEDVKTLKGENVRSIGELLIANYLFMHDIEYEYEEYYPFIKYSEMITKRFLDSASYLSLNQIADCSNKELIDNFVDWDYGWKSYRPDFYLPEYNLYLEHFGVDKNMEASFLIGEAKEKYEKSMLSKEKYHELFGTKLIETYFYYLPEGRLLKELENLLNKNGVTIGQVDKKKIMDALINNERVNDFDNFSKLVKSFINIYESKNLKKADFNLFRSKNKTENIYEKNRHNIFFDIVEEIYNDYYDENLKGDLSHNHEIFNALDLIKTKQFNKKYDYIFVDEYQDINHVRCQLLQELQKNSNAKMFVVGDDWQSIYGFVGSQVSLFVEFDKYFSNPEIVKIKENRRNPQKLIDISSDFIITKNKQDKKELKYFKDTATPNLDPIKIVKYKINIERSEIGNITNIESDYRSKTLKLGAIIDYILEYSQNPKILILGRNNDDIDDYVGNDLFKIKGRNKIKKIIYSSRQDLDITFMTIHQAKGLEADEVIILNLEDRYGGFPNQIVDDPILGFVKEDNENKFAEERRLLYVALTRSENNVYLLTPVEIPSQFIGDLKLYDGVTDLNLTYNIRRKNLHTDHDFLEDLIIHPTKLKCPNCDDGKISIIENNVNKTTYVRCNLHPRSKEHYDGGPYPKWGLNDIKYVEKCPNCRGILVRNGDILKCCLNYKEGCMETKELNLEKEDLEFDYE